MKSSIGFKCELCLKNFETKISFELHARYCYKQEEPEINLNNWENFRIDDLIVPEEYNNHDINANDQNIHENISESYVENLSANHHNQNNEEDHHDSYYSANSLNDEEQNMSYENLLILDENLKNPLNDFYLTMLVPEKIQASTISHLSEESKKCLICLEDFENNNFIIRLPCFHIFHQEEINYWFRENKKCPICRVDIEELLSKY